MAINRDLNVKIKASLLITEVLDQDDPEGRKAGLQGKTQQIRTINYQAIDVDDTEFRRRLADAADVLLYGYELSGTEPPRAVTGAATVITKNSALLNGLVYPNTNTSCGFLYGLTRELDNTGDASQSPIALASDDPTAISAPIIGLANNTRYYYRAWAQLAGVEVRYGRIRSFKTLVA